MAEEVAKAASALQTERTGHAPGSVTAVLSDGTLVITLHGALTPAERALASSPAGAARVQEFHRQLFADSSAGIRDAIRRITGMEVREAAAEVEPTTGAIVHVFTSGAMVQVFLLRPRDGPQGSDEDRHDAAPPTPGARAPPPTAGGAEPDSDRRRGE